MRSLRRILLCSILLFLPGAAQAAALGPIETHQHPEYDVKVISDQPLAPPAGTEGAAVMERRTIIDINSKRPAPPEDEEHVKIFAGRNDADITDQVTVQPPVVAILYMFSGIEAADQCRYKIFLDGLLMLSDSPNLAFSDVDNDVCPDFGISRIDGGISQVLAKVNVYMRLLLVRVDAHGSTAGEANIPKTIWRQLHIREGEFNDRGVLARKLGAFVGQNTNGAFIFVPESAGSVNRPLLLSVFRKGQPYWTVELRKAPSLFRVPELTPQFLTGIGLLLMLVFMIAVKLMRRPSPVREISVGYGPGCAITLGPEGDGPVVLLRIHKGNKIELEKLSPAAVVLVDGKEVSEKAWIKPSDRLLIDGKKVRFS